MSQLKIKSSLAELVVIVIGVLIALLAESAWQDYRDRAEGREYVARLATEVRVNLGVLEGDGSWARYSCASANSALAQLQRAEDEVDPTKFLHSVILASLYSNPEYQTATHDDLIGTGGLSLIDNATLRSTIVAAYTNFFESLDAWRPPKDVALRASVLRTIPGDFLNRVSADCIEYEGPKERVANLADCSTVPSGASSRAMFDQLVALPTLEGDLRERAWQVCEFEEDMSDVAKQFEELADLLESASAT